MKIKDLKVGDYFMLKPNGRVYVRGHYDRSSKRYSYSDYSDFCREHFAKGDKEVITDLFDADFSK